MLEQALTYGQAQATTPAEPTVDLETHLRMLVRYFEESEDMTRSARARSERCRDYYANRQYTPEEEATLRRRGQAPVYENFIQRKVDTLCGIERRTRTDPKAFPRNPDDEQVAGAATDSLRYVSDQNRFNGIRSEVFNDILVEGFGGAEVIVERKPNGDDMVVIRRVPWDRLWFDPHSRALDFEDAAYKGIVIWADAKQAALDYPDRDEAIEETVSDTSNSDTYSDRPKFTWCDSSRKRIRIVECHYQHDGEWWIATYTKGGFLVDPVISPYKDKYGHSACSLIMRAGFVDRENNRFGHVESLIPLQDEINKRRSKALHLLSSRQTYGNKIAVPDLKKAKTELAKPDGHLEINAGAKFGDDFGVLPTGDMALGQFQMYQQAVASMNATGANAALQGKDERVQSGRALEARAQMGAIEIEPQADGLREWTHQVYEATWMRIRQFWTAEKWVRVTDDDRNMKWVGLNKPITLQDKLNQLQPQEAAQLAQQLGIQGPQDPRLKQVVEVENDVSGLDVDIVVDEGPDVQTLQSEQFSQLVELAKTPQGQQAIPFTAIIKASTLRNKDVLLDEIEQRAKQQAEAQQKMQEEAHAAGRAAAEADIAKSKTEAEKNAAETLKTNAQTTQIQVDTQVTGLTYLRPPPEQPIQ